MPNLNEIIETVLKFIVLCIAVFVGVFWFWKKYYDVIKNIPVSDFSELFKNTFAICYLGCIGLSVVCELLNYSKLTQTTLNYIGTIALFTPFLAAFIYWNKKTEQYSINIVKTDD
jgi:flagellar biosynthesis protein FlhB